MIYDELIEELALTLLTKARYEGCISVIDGFSQCEEDKIRMEYPVDAVMRIMPVGSEIWPEECEPLLKKIGAETIGDVADYLNKNKSENSSADDVLLLHCSKSAMKIWTWTARWHFGKICLKTTPWNGEMLNDLHTRSDLFSMQS